MVGIFIYIFAMMDKVSQVRMCLLDPKSNLAELSSLSLELCNNPVNITCSSCITDAVKLLSNWLKKQGIQNDFFQRALSGEYELKKINLFVQVYKSDNSERQKELDVCLRINRYLNTNGIKWFNVIEINDRLTFRQMFELTKSHPDNINIIANSDIYFDETILMCRFMKPNECLALSRWDYKNGRAKLFNRKDSQDVWIFDGSVNCNGGDYYLGIPGCDNKIAWELKQAGYTVLNPSKSIHAIHLHNTEYRTYTPDQRLHDPFHFIFPHH